MAALPDPTIRPCLSADEAFTHLGIDRNTGYRAIRDGTFPVPVIRVGRVIRVPTGALRRLLVVDGSTAQEGAEYPEATEADADLHRATGDEPSASARPMPAPQREPARRRQNRLRQADGPGAA